MDENNLIRLQRSNKYIVNRSDNILNKYFICVLCNDIVNNPKCCSKCNEHFCEDCQLSNQNLNYVCFYGCENPIYIKPHKTYLGLLDNLRFNCLFDCNTIIDYNETPVHFRICKKNSISSCSNNDCEFKGTQNMINSHICQSNSKTICNVCNQQKLQNHNCADDFLKLKLDLEIQLNKLIEKYDHKFKQLEDLSLYIHGKIQAKDFK